MDDYFRASLRDGEEGRQGRFAAVRAFAGTEKAAETVWIWSGNGEEHTSAAEADIDSVDIVPEINPRPAV